MNNAPSQARQKIRIVAVVLLTGALSACPKSHPPAKECLNPTKPPSRYVDLPTGSVSKPYRLREELPLWSAANLSAFATTCAVYVDRVSTASEVCKGKTLLKPGDLVFMERPNNSEKPDTLYLTIKSKNAAGESVNRATRVPMTEFPLYGELLGLKAQVPLHEAALEENADQTGNALAHYYVHVARGPEGKHDKYYWIDAFDGTANDCLTHFPDHTIKPEAPGIIPVLNPWEIDLNFLQTNSGGGGEPPP